MERLLPVKHLYQSISVPYIGEYKYDGLDFAGSPSRNQLNLDRPEAGNVRGFPFFGVSAILQTWLYFGAIDEILNTSMIADHETR